MHCLIIVLSVAISHSQSLIMTEACICHKMYIPVCGSDGKTYGNECEFKCALNDLKEKNNEESTPELHIIYYEPCRPNQEENPECACFRDLDYVCGTDGKTYNNECVLNCIISDAKREATSDKSTKELEVKVAYRGKCSEKKNELYRG